MSKIIEIFEKLGELDWYAIRPSELITGGKIPLYPPLVTLRYHEGNKTASSRLLHALNYYKGNVVWDITGVGAKNMCLMPTEVSKRISQGVSAIDAIQAVITANPAFVQSTVDDFPNLIDYLDKYFQQKNVE